MSVLVVPGSVLAGILWDVSKLVFSAIGYVVQHGWRNQQCPACEARKLIRNQHSTLHVRFSDDEDAVIIAQKVNTPVHL